MSEIAVGGLYVCEVEGTDLARFSPKAKRPVLLVHAESGYGAVYPLSTSAVGGRDVELVHEMWEGRHVWLVRTQGLFMVPLARLEPLGRTFGGMKRLRSEGLEREIALWRGRHRAELEAGPARPEREPLRVKLEEVVPILEVDVAPPPPSPRGPEPQEDLMAAEFARLGKKKGRYEREGALTTTLGDLGALAKIAQRIADGPAHPAPSSARPAQPAPGRPVPQSGSPPAPAARPQEEVDFAAEVEAWSKAQGKGKLAKKPEPLPPKPAAPPPDETDAPRLRPGFRRNPS